MIAKNPRKDPLEVFHTVTDGLESPEGSTYTLQTANGVFVSNAADVPNLFESELDSVFNGNLHSVDFAGDSVAATNTINQWVRMVISNIRQFLTLVRKI